MVLVCDVIQIFTIGIFGYLYYKGLICMSSKQTPKIVIIVFSFTIGILVREILLSVIFSITPAEWSMELCVILISFSSIVMNIFILMLIKCLRQKHEERSQLQIENATLEEILEEVYAENHTVNKVIPVVMQTLNGALSGMSIDEIENLPQERKNQILNLYRIYLGDEKTKAIEYQRKMALPQTAWDSLNYYFAECNKRAIKDNVSLRFYVYADVSVLDKMEIPPLEVQKVLADHIDNAFKKVAELTNKRGVIEVYFVKSKGIYEIRIEDNAPAFPLDIIANLGKRGVTDGGTGQGFTNTLENLANYKASLIIQEYAPENECVCNKAITIRFDSLNQFRIESYREDEIKAVKGKGTADVEYAELVIDKKPQEYEHLNKVIDSLNEENNKKNARI